ncbi:DUF4097 family beta strand repeat-containing protein [Teredinibacter purpureus]|uniref:DUF4097 family beta strand repeat-containing protein n=1 Tax=Teredinibacter purpureus TaxID=2731756 RepID=UPI0005F8939D|nr:DUF4097 family beta strand repeat-containing protein [Teredinibacter purpureus]
MKKLASNVVIMAIIACLSLPALASNVQVKEKNFDLADINELVLSMDHADITIVNDDSGTLNVVLRQELKWGDATVCLQTLKHNVSNHRLEVLTYSVKQIINFGCKVNRTVSIRLSQSNLKKLIVKHQHGSLTADEFSADHLMADIAHSDVTIQRLNSADSVMKLAHSSVTVDSVTVDTLRLDGAHGKLNIQQLTAQTADIAWAHGEIIVDSSRIEESAVKQQHGAITLHNHQGEALVVDSAHGDIRILQAELLRATLENQHSTIEFSGGSETLEVSNAHGRTSLTQTNRNFDTINNTSSHGSLVLNLPANSACEFIGYAATELRAKAFKNEALCAGTNNGLVKLNTSHTNVQVHTF